MKRICSVVVGAVLAALLTQLPAVAVESKPEWGSVRAPNGVLRASCRSYTYSYAVTAPEKGDWDLNISLVGPGGRPLWFGYLYEGANPDQGTSTFRLCGSKTKPGRYKLKAIVSVQDGDDITEGSLTTARFRLSRPR